MGFPAPPTGRRGVFADAAAAAAAAGGRRREADICTHTHKPATHTHTHEFARARAHTHTHSRCWRAGRDAQARARARTGTHALMRTDAHAEGMKSGSDARHHGGWWRAVTGRLADLRYRRSRGHVRVGPPGPSGPSGPPARRSAASPRRPTRLSVRNPTHYYPSLPSPFPSCRVAFGGGPGTGSHGAGAAVLLRRRLWHTHRDLGGQ